MADKIHLDECYPYTYVRVTTMKSKLLGRDDYNKLLKMGFGEISKYLQDSEYKKEINELALHLRGADLIEAALDKNLIASFNKLWRISPEELDLLINAYAKRFDIFNIKTIIRGKFAKLSKEEITSSIKPVGVFSSKMIESMMNAESIEKILEMSKLLNKKELGELKTKLSSNKSLMAVENALDKAYFNYVFEFSDRIPAQGHLFKEFLLKEIDVVNLKIVLRLKKEGINSEDIVNHVCIQKHMPQWLDRLITSNHNEIYKILETTPFKHLIKKHKQDIENKSSLIRLENELDKYLLKISLSLLHQNPLSIDIILGYMFAKEIEIMNLKILVKGKQLSMDEAFISEQLIV